MKKSSSFLWSLALGLSAVPLIAYFFKYNGSFATEHSRWGEFGSYISGVYGALAFLVLAYTTNITRRQFRIQNEDSVFFKLFDTLQNRIINSAIVVHDGPHTGHDTTKALATCFYRELSEETIEIARLLLCNDPNSVSSTHYMKIFEALNGMRFIDSFEQDKEDFINDIESQPNFNAKWEQLKMYIGSRGEEPEHLRDALRATGSVHFYKIPFSERRHYYSVAAQRMAHAHGEFLSRSTEEL